MSRSLRTLALAILAALWLASLALGQQPDHRGEAVLSTPEYQGTKASAPIPPDEHVRNEGGSDGAGLCVIASILANGQFQDVPALEGAKDSDLWRTAKQRPGGYAPSKLAALVEEVMPAEGWASYVGRDTSVLERLSEQGYPIGATMNTGALYGYSPIHHMVSLIHYRANGLACVVDNNRPGSYSWMPAAEFDRRWIDGGTGWAWVWTRLPAPEIAGLGLLPLTLAGVAVLLIVARWRSEPA